MSSGERRAAGCTRTVAVVAPGAGTHSCTKIARNQTGGACPRQNPAWPPEGLLNWFWSRRLRFLRFRPDRLGVRGVGDAFPSWHGGTTMGHRPGRRPCRRAGLAALGGVGGDGRGWLGWPGRECPVAGVPLAYLGAEELSRRGEVV